jgi:ribosomal protein L13
MPIISPAHRTPSLKKEETKKSWFVVDAQGKTLGRLCSAVATRLRGKHKATFTPNQDCGDNIIIINAAKVQVTGRKREQKIYYHHSLYPFNGQGTFDSYTGEKYVGQFKNGTYNGKGTLTLPDGTAVAAEFLNGNPQGGELTYPDKR